MTSGPSRTGTLDVTQAHALDASLDREAVGGGPADRALWSALELHLPSDVATQVRAIFEAGKPTPVGLSQVCAGLLLRELRHQRDTRTHDSAAVSQLASLWVRAVALDKDTGPRRPEEATVGVDAGIAEAAQAAAADPGDDLGV